MSGYAYRDKEKTIKVSAKDFHTEDLDTRFYCPYKKCNAIMGLRQRKGQSGKGACFAALPTHPHSKNPLCPYGTFGSEFKPEDTSEGEFDFDKSMGALEKESTKSLAKKNPGKKDHREGGKKRISTVLRIYQLCKFYDCTDKYNDFTIGYMLLDDRSLHMYPNGVYAGNRVIEGKKANG